MHSHRFPAGRWEQILNHARRRASIILVVSVVASVYLFWKCDTRAQSASNLPTAQEPQLAEPGDWATDFNQAQMACYEGSMKACDSIWKATGSYSIPGCLTTAEPAAAALISARLDVRTSPVLKPSRVTSRRTLTNDALLQLQELWVDFLDAAFDRRR